MSTALEETHEIPMYIRAGRTRALVIMLILSDALSVLAIFAGAIYLSALNVENQYRISGDHPPAILPGVIVAIALVLSGAAFYWWERSRGNQGGGMQATFIVSLLLMIVAAVIQIVQGAGLGYSTTPLHSYESVIILLVWYSAAHFVLAAFLGLLFLGRILRGRLVGHDYIVTGFGYWWYYTIIAALLMWVFSLVLA